MYWPDSTAWDVWSEKHTHTHTDPGGNGTDCCGAFFW